MNIQKLEAVLDEMRTATFPDPAHARDLVATWADRIADAITEHLIAELGGGMAPAAAAPGLAAEPGGHDWDDFEECGAPK